MHVCGTGEHGCPGAFFRAFFIDRPWVIRQILLHAGRIAEPGKLVGTSSKKEFLRMASICSAERVRMSQCALPLAIQPEGMPCIAG